MSPFLRRHGTTLAIVAAAAAMGAVVLVVDKGSITTDERAARRRKLLPAFREDDVTEVKLTTHGKAARVFRGALDDAGQRPWQVEIDGSVYPAEEPVVDQYLGSLRDGTVERWVKSGAENAGEAGALIAVEMGRQHFLVTLRGPAPTPAGAVYAEIAGGDEPETAVITAQLAAVLLAAPESFRRKALVSYGPADVEEIRLRGEHGESVLRRAPWPAPRGGAFTVDGRRVAVAALDKIWDAVGKLEADAFLADGEADKALARSVTLGLTPKGGGGVSIDLGGVCPGHPDDVVAVLRPAHGARTNACVPHGALEELDVEPEKLPDVRAVGARGEEVVDVKLSAGATTVALARSGSGWHEQAPVDRAVEPEVGKAFLEALLDVAGTLGPTPNPDAHGLETPRATVRVVSRVPSSAADGGDAERTELLQVGDEDHGLVYVLRVEDGALMRVPADAAASLFPSEVALRARQIYDEPFAHFRSLRVEAPGRVQRFEQGAGGWAVVEPKGQGLVPDGSLIGDVGGVLGQLSAERWVGPARPDHGLEHPRLVVEAELQESGGGGDAGSRPRTLRVAIGAPAGSSGSFARAGDDGTVFVVSRRMETAADRWLFDRTALLADAAHVTRVTLTGEGGKKLSLTSSGGAFHVEGAGGDPVANAKAARVREAVGDLFAEGVVSVGAAEAREGLEKPVLVMEAEVAGRPVRVRFGATDTVKGVAVVYARRDGVDATYAVAATRVRPLLDAVGGR